MKQKEEIQTNYVSMCPNFSLGFKFDFSIFTDSVNPEIGNQGKFPYILQNYESSNVPDMFFG